MSRRHNIENSRHHLWYPARDYETHDWLHDLREQHIVLMHHAGHVALHKAVEPPSLPSMEMVADYLDAYDLAQPERGVESFEFAEEYFAYNYIHYTGHEDKQEQMLSIANNISRQLKFFKGHWME